MQEQKTHKIAVMLGTRPEAIKLIPVINEFKKHNTQIETKVIVTGQHREILRQMLKLFEVEPDLDLDLMTHNQSLAQISSKSIEALGKYINDNRPDLVVVQGDTTTTFCAALAAFYHK